MTTVVEWAESQRVKPHHSRCAVNAGGECDCYRQQIEFQVADAILACRDFLVVLHADVYRDGEEHWDPGDEPDHGNNCHTCWEERLLRLLGEPGPEDSDAR